MDLTQSFSDQQWEDVLLTNVSYEIEEIGHHIDTPVFHMRGRNTDGDLVTVEVEGFRPYFGIKASDFREKAMEICNDRRVIGVEVDCSPELWQGTIGFEDDQDPDEWDVEAFLTDRMGADVYHVSNPYTSIYDEELVKIYTRVPSDVGGKTGLRGSLDCETFEADIPFVRRFLISSEIYQAFRFDTSKDRIRYENWPGESDGYKCERQLEPCDPPEIKPRMIIYDIEVATEGDGFPQPERALHPVTAISAYDNYDDSYRLWGLVSDEWEQSSDNIVDDVLEDVSSRDGFPSIGSDDFELFENETQLLESFHSWVLERDPDIFTGYNSDGFDHPYLIQRSYNIQALSIKQYGTTGTPGVWVEEYKGNRQVNFSLPDRITLDILDAYRKTQFRELDSYKLDDVAEAELGYGKTGLAGDELDDAWHYTPIEFFVYSIRDAQATAEVEKQAGLLDLFENLRRVTGAPYENAVNNGPMLDILFLRRAHEKSLMLPSNKVPDENVYHGARVFAPVPGVHKNCVYPDLSSLYPSLFSMLNLGSETIIGDKSDLEESEYTEEDCFKFPVDEREFAVVKKGESISHIDRDEYKGVKTPDGGVREMFDPQYDWFYVLKPDVKESFIRDSIDDLISLKYQYSGQLYSAIKRVTNSCFTPDTDVLTPDGVRNICDIEVGDMVYSLNTESNELEYKKVTELIEKPDYRGELVEIQNIHTDLKMTPDHRLYVRRSRYTDEWEITEAGELNEYTHYEAPHNFTRDGPGIDTVDIAQFVKNADFGSDTPIINDDSITTERGRKTVPRYYDGDAFIELLAWYITEEEIRILNSVIPGVLNEVCGDCSETKQIPEFIFEKASLEQKKELIETLMLGDGDKRESPRRYRTKSERLRDDFVRLCIECGYDAHYKYDDGGEYNSGVWRVHFCEDRKNSFRMYRNGDTSNAENGVYCIQVEDNHTLLAGRNGKFTAVPNCYGVLGDSSSGGKGSRLYDRRIAEGITMAGRLTITHTAEEFTQYLNDNYDPDAILVGGDTDSSTTSIPNAPDLETALDWAQEAVEHVDNSYDQFVVDTFGFDPDDDHRLAVELETLASALFYMEGDTEENYVVNDDGMLVKQNQSDGVRKRYAQSIVWNDDGGWLDTEDPDEGYEEALEDPEDRSDLKKEQTVTYETYESGPLSHMNPHDNVSITGFEYVRSDSAQVTRDAQMQILTDMLLSSDPESRIKTYIQGLVDDIESGDVSLDNLARPKGISQNLDEYGWKDIDELDESDVTERIEAQGGDYVQTPGPTYRGAKYANDWLSWEDLGEGSKPMKVPIEKVRGDEYPAVYEYHSYPADDSWPDPPEVGREVDAIAVENTDRLPEQFVVDVDTIIEKELEDKLEGILNTIGLDWDDLLNEGTQSGLDQWI